MNQTPTYIIVDDNEADRIMTKILLSQYTGFSLLKTYENPLKAIEDQPILSPDIAFIDIDMPELNGIELRKRLESLEICIFVTSHPEFALEGFELAAFDYIVKPLSRDRLVKTMDRLTYYFEIKQKAHLLDHALGGDHIVIKDGNQNIRIPTHKILYLEAYKDYTKIVTREKSHCILSNLGKLLQEDTFASFVRIHKSFAVQKNMVDKASSKEVSIQGIILPVGRSFKSNISALGL